MASNAAVARYRSVAEIERGGIPSIAARNAIKFLATQAKISELDAYALCSIAVSFRVTQVVDIVRGVHALIPKNIFANELRQQMKMV
jgi:acetamidase/formamidase